MPGNHDVNVKHESDNIEIEMSLESFCPVPGLQGENTGYFSHDELEGMNEKEFLRELERVIKDFEVSDREILDSVEAFYRIHAPERVETMLGLFKYSLAHRFTYKY